MLLNRSLLSIFFFLVSVVIAGCDSRNHDKIGAVKVDLFKTERGAPPPDSASSKWTNIQPGKYVGSFDGTVWLRIRNLPKLMDSSHVIFLRDIYPEEVVLTTFKGSKVIERQVFGTDIEVEQRILSYFIPAFHVSPRADSLLFSIVSKDPIRTDLGLVDMKGFAKQESTKLILLGLFFGFMLAISSYYILLYSRSRVRAFLVYGLYVMSLTAWLMSVEGYFSFISGTFNNYLSDILPPFVFSGLLMFFGIFVPEHVESKFPKYGINTLQFIFILTVPIQCVRPGIWPAIISYSILMSATLFVAFSSLILSRRSKQARIFAIAVTPSCVFAFVRTLINLDVLPFTESGKYLVLGSLLWEVSILGYGVSAWISDIQNDNKAIKKERDLHQAIAATTHMLAHDVRKPFSTVQAAMTMFESTNSIDEVRSMMPMARQSVDQALTRVNAMLQDIMELGKSAELYREPISPKHLVRNSLEEVSQIYREGQIYLSYRWEHTESASVDPEKVQRVFSNIFANAFQAMRFKGRRLFIWTPSMHGLLS